MPDPAIARLAETMAASLGHRGPDDSGAYSTGTVAFGFRRLSILDLTPAGHQPFLSADGQVVLVFNGEIFNYAELRAELKRLGHEFRSTGDTEVLLNAYIEWGPACLERLNGMWAFLLHDLRTGAVFGARDRFGIKPLYYTHEGARRYFASEIKALQAVLPGCREVDLGRVATFLAAGTLESHHADQSTFFTQVREVEPGTWFSITPGGDWRVGRYWSLPEESPGLEHDPAVTFRDLLINAVELRLRSDVPVGVSLSGGLDSTAIICAMARLRAAETATTACPLHAFSYMPARFDESQYIRATLQQTGATAHRVELSPRQWLDELPAVLRSHDEPVHSATASVGYAIYREAAAAGVKVLLGGQGADETLGGYPSYFPEQWHSLLRTGRWRRCVKEVQDHATAHGGSPAGEMTRALLRLVLTLANRFAFYRAAMTHRRTTRMFPQMALLSPGAADLVCRDAAPQAAGLRPALVEGTTRTPLPLYLRIEDRNSMAHSVEARLPFLDYRLVSLAFQLAGDWKIRGRWNKYVLREGTRDLMPEVVRTRVDKMGFPTEIDGWMRGELRPVLAEIFESSQFRQRGLCAPDAAARLLGDHAAGIQDAGPMLFHLVQTELWLRGVAEG